MRSPVGTSCWVGGALLGVALDFMVGRAGLHMGENTDLFLILADLLKGEGQTGSEGERQRSCQRTTEDQF